MEPILYNIGQVLGITIIHSLWQGLILYMVLRVVFTAIPALPSVKKYNLAIVAMASIAVWFFYTLFIEFSSYNWTNLKLAPATTLINPAYQLQAQHHQSSSFYRMIAAYLPYVSVLYLIGLLVNLTKLGWEWNKIRLIKQSLIPAEQMQQYINKFSKKLNINKYIQLKFSNIVNVPCTIGYFKPLILLPVSLATYLSACEVEAILLHELSHIKRNDYLINLLQQVISVILFFNPFAQLINRIINLERENGCDDLVVEKTGKPLIYAQALLKLEENRGPQLKLALAATGKKNYLLHRIERIMKTKKPIGNIRHLLIATLLLAGGLGSIAWFNPEIANGKPANAKGLKSLAKAKSNLAQQALTAFAYADDSNKYIRISDTSKKKKGTVAAADTNANKKEYNIADSADHSENYNFNFNFNNEPWADSLKKFYSGAAWKKQVEMMKQQGEEMRKKFNSPEWKQQMMAMNKQGEWMKKQFDNPEWKAQMEKQGEWMKKQFDNPEWKAQMKKQGELMKKQFDNPEWKAQMKKQGELMKKQFDNPEWKAQMEKQGELMKKQFDNPEWKEQMEKQGELMKKQFDNPEWKEEMKKQGELMKKQFDSPEWKKQMEDMQFYFKDSTNFNFKDSTNFKHKAKAVKKSVKKG